MKFFHPGAVRLTGGAFRHALLTDRDYVMSLDVDRLLAPFRIQSGLETRKDPYGNWESMAITGHTAGHVVSALAFLSQQEDGFAAGVRLDRMVSELAEIQLPSGWLGGVPGGEKLFEDLRTGGVDAARRIGSHEHWVPWYNLHKTMQGLLDAHLVAGNEQALDIVVKMADWWHDIAADVTDEAFETMLDTEYGGINEVFAILATVAGRDIDRAMARRFSHRHILDPLLEGRDDLTGEHANTQIPKIVGYATTGEADLVGAANVFWDTVTRHRTVAIGGNSVREHFHDPRNFAVQIDDREGPETCNTFNMLKLTRALAENDFRPELIDFAERALFNHVLSAQHPDGGFVYFTSMRPRHYRVYSAAQECFWCCVGTGMEMQARYAEWIFGLDGDDIAINIFAPASLDDGEVSIDIETEFPARDDVLVRVNTAGARAIRIRVPAWAGELADLRINGEAAEGSAVPGAVALSRDWQAGDEITFRAPLTLRTEQLPDGSAWQAYLAGPIVLASRDEGSLPGLIADDGRMGQVAAGELLPLADVAVVPEGIEGVTPLGGLRYEVAGVTLEPFAGIHDSRYTIYFPTDGEGLSERDHLLDLDVATIDAIAFGEQQPEADHQAHTDGAPLGSAGGERWRSLGTGLSALVRDPERLARWIRVEVRPSEGEVGFVVRNGSHEIARRVLAPGETTTSLAIFSPGPEARIHVDPIDGVAGPELTRIVLGR